MKERVPRGKIPRRNSNGKEIFSHSKAVMIGDASQIVFDFHLNVVVLLINSGTYI